MTYRITEDKKSDASSGYDRGVAWSLVDDAQFSEPVIARQNAASFRQTCLAVHL